VNLLPNPLRQLAVGFGLVLGLAACGSTSMTTAPAPPEPPVPVAPSDPQLVPAEQCSPIDTVATWPIEKRVSQVLFAGVNTNRKVDSYPMGTATYAVSEGVGGVNFLGDNPGVYARGELAGVTAAGVIPPFLALDQEGGRVQRLTGIGFSLPSARELGATKTPDEIREIGAWVGYNMGRLGFNMNFAPNVDVSDQPFGAVAGDRSFDDDPIEASADAEAFAEGLNREGIIPVIKHFPGLGSATGNTDHQPATTPPLEQLQNRDLIPYRLILEDESVAVMMSSAVVPGLSGDMPAGLSPAAVDLLRTNYGFEGLIITDSLDGKAITSRYTVEDAAVLALMAGNDMVLWDRAGNIPAVRQAVLVAIADGRIAEDQINQSVMRILALKGYDPCSAAAG
jgi:beta-N-acetylhexosaminidase